MILLRQKLYSKRPKEENEKMENSRIPEEKIGKDIGTAAGIGVGGIEAYKINKNISKYSKRIQDNPEKIKEYIRKVYKPVPEIAEELAKDEALVGKLSRNATKYGNAAKAGTIGLGLILVPIKMRKWGGKIGKKISDKRNNKKEKEL